MSLCTPERPSFHEGYGLSMNWSTVGEMERQVRGACSRCAFYKRRRAERGLFLLTRIHGGSLSTTKTAWLAISLLSRKLLKWHPIPYLWLSAGRTRTGTNPSVFFTANGMTKVPRLLRQSQDIWRSLGHKIENKKTDETRRRRSKKFQITNLSSLSS
jgi:hypothetical protein